MYEITFMFSVYKKVGFVKNKKQTKQQLGEGVVKMIHAKNAGVPYKPGRKDECTVTTARVFCPDLLENTILKECLSWLRRRRVVCDRMNVGAGQIGISGFHTYGIKGAGDIIGLTQRGIHFEIEVKRGRGGLLSLAQQKRMEKIRANKGIYLVIHGIPELELYNELYGYFK